MEQPPEVDDKVLNHLWDNIDDLPDDDFDDDTDSPELFDDEQPGTTVSENQ